MKNDLIVFGAKYLFLLVVVMAGLNWRKLNSKKRTQFLAALVLAGIVSVILVKILGKLYYHPRPFVSSGIKPLVAHAADNGFPSEHATYTAAISAVIYFYRRKYAAIAFGLAILVGLSRIWAHVHSPLDILAGLLTGLAAGMAGYYLAKTWLRVSD